MNLLALKTHLTNVMPILEVNLSAAYQGYMDANISAGAYGMVRQRQATALALVARDDVAALEAYSACALLAIDLRSGVADMPNPTEAQLLVDGWWQCYRNAGFTDVHKLFNAPILPSGAVRM